VRSRAGVGDFEQIQEGRDVHLFRVITGIRLREVEDKIGASFGEAAQ
jgi:hypothetical protein